MLEVLAFSAESAFPPPLAEAHPADVVVEGGELLRPHLPAEWALHPLQVADADVAERLLALGALVECDLEVGLLHLVLIDGDDVNAAAFLAFRLDVYLLVFPFQRPDKVFRGGHSLIWSYTSIKQASAMD